MGRLGAVDMAAHADLRTALGWHLSSNHFPPHPPQWMGPCLEAIEAAKDRDWDRLIELPRGCATHRVLLDKNEDGTWSHEEGCEIGPAVTWKDDRDTVEASLLVESFHLADLITQTPDVALCKWVCDVDRQCHLRGVETLPDRVALSTGELRAWLNRST